MLSLILAILFGLSITFFAFQNSASTPIVIGSFFLPSVPVYLVVIVSMLTGILMAWFISAIEGMSHMMNVRRKDNLIRDDRKSMVQMEEKIKRLEAENANLKQQRDPKEVVVEDRHDAPEYIEHARRPSFFERFFPSSTRHYSKHI